MHRVRATAAQNDEKDMRQKLKLRSLGRRLQIKPHFKAYFVTAASRLYTMKWLKLPDNTQADCLGNYLFAI